MGGIARVLRAQAHHLIMPEPGTFAWDPETCEALRRAEDAFRKTVAARGCREVATPTFDAAETFRPLGADLAHRLFAFSDSGGARLALRPEITTSVARLFATTLADRDRPVRLFYLGQVFRQAGRFSGEWREFRQAGVEIFGAPAPAGDVEILRIARAVLEAVGAGAARIEIGHSGIVRGLLAASDCDSAREAEIRDAIHRKAPGDLARAAEGLPTRDGLAWLASLEAGATTPEDAQRVLSRAREILSPKAADAAGAIRTALAELEAVLAAAGDARATLDLGVARGLDYYTGIVFEAFHPGVAGPVLGGGRYDRLASAFGAEAPAAGFSLEIERILRADFPLKFSPDSADRRNQAK